MAKKLGLTMQYPEGYLEAQREQEERKAAEKADLAASSSSSASGVDEEEESKKKKRKGRKRKLSVPGKYIHMCNIHTCTCMYVD